MLTGALVVAVLALAWYVHYQQTVLRRLVEAAAQASTGLEVEKARLDLLVSLTGGWILGERARVRADIDGEKVRLRREMHELHLFRLMHPDQEVLKVNEVAARTLDLYLQREYGRTG